MTDISALLDPLTRIVEALTAIATPQPKDDWALIYTEMDMWKRHEWVRVRVEYSKARNVGIIELVVSDHIEYSSLDFEHPDAIIKRFTGESYAIREAQAALANFSAFMEKELPKIADETPIPDEFL